MLNDTYVSVTQSVTKRDASHRDGGVTSRLEESRGDKSTLHPPLLLTVERTVPGRARADGGGGRGVLNEDLHPTRGGQQL